MSDGTLLFSVLIRSPTLLVVALVAHADDDLGNQLGRQMHLSGPVCPICCCFFLAYHFFCSLLSSVFFRTNCTSSSHTKFSGNSFLANHLIGA